MDNNIIAFDVNETLLDLSSLDPLFDQVFGDAGVRRQWFAQMLILAMTGGLTGQYLRFSSAQHAALEMISDRAGITLSNADMDTIITGMRRLSPHADVPVGLAALLETPHRLVALTNSEKEIAEEQLSHAGIRHMFEAVHSADEVQRLKPAPEPYLMVANAHGVTPDRVWLVAAHAWDVSGAMAAGCRAAFVSRPGMVPSPVGPAPHLAVKDLIELSVSLPSHPKM